MRFIWPGRKGTCEPGVEDSMNKNVEAGLGTGALGIAILEAPVQIQWGSLLLCPWLVARCPAL